MTPRSRRSLTSGFVGPRAIPKENPSWDDVGTAVGRFEYYRKIVKRLAGLDGATAVRAVRENGTQEQLQEIARFMGAWFLDDAVQWADKNFLLGGAIAGMSADAQESLLASRASAYPSKPIPEDQLQRQVRANLAGSLAQIDLLAQKTQTYLDKVGPESTTYKGFKVTNPHRLADHRLLAALGMIDHILAVFKKRGVEDTITSTINTFEVRWWKTGENVQTGPRKGDPAAGYYSASKKRVTLIADRHGINLGVLAHEIGHHIHLSYLHPEAKRAWDEGWDPHDEAIKGPPIHTIEVTQADRKRFFDLLVKTAGGGKEVRALWTHMRKNTPADITVTEESDWGSLIFMVAQLVPKFGNGPVVNSPDLIKKVASKLNGEDLAKFRVWLYKAHMIQGPKQLRPTYNSPELSQFLTAPTSRKLSNDSLTQAVETLEKNLKIRGSHRYWFNDVREKIERITARFEHYEGWLFVEDGMVQKMEVPGRRKTTPERALRDLDIPTEYGRTNVMEDFADTFKLLITNPQKLSETALYRMKRALSRSGFYGKPVMRMAAKVADQFLKQASVTIHIDADKTAAARRKYGSKSMVVGYFESSVKLYRILDGEELRTILGGGWIGGGSYSIPAEREFGASWGENKNEVVKWGESQRGRRLGHELFLAELDARHFWFASLGIKGALDAVGEVTVSQACSTGHGCSVRAKPGDVKNWYTVDPGGGLQRISASELKARAQTVGQKPRTTDLFMGGLGYPKGSLAKALQRANEEAMIRSRMPPGEERDGVLYKLRGPTLHNAGDDLVGLIRGGIWTTSEGMAEGEAAEHMGDGTSAFPLLAIGKGEVIVAPDHTAKPAQVEVSMVHLYVPDLRRWTHIWQGRVKVKP